MLRTHSCILVDLKARSAKGARFSGVHPKGGNSQCSNVCLWRTFAKNAARRKPSFDLLYHAHKIVQIGVSARGHFLQKCAIDRHLSTENFPLWGGPLKSEHLWLNVLLNPPKYTNGFGVMIHLSTRCDAPSTSRAVGCDVRTLECHLGVAYPSTTW